MITTKKTLLLFVPAVLMACFFLFIAISQYTPLYPSYDQDETVEALDFIPILKQDAILGSKNAPKTIIVFEDIGCASCREQIKIFQSLLTKYPNQIKIIWKGLAATKFPRSSQPAHDYAFCANEQNKFSSVLSDLFEQQELLTEGTLNIVGQSNDIDQTAMTECLQSDRPRTYSNKQEDLARSIGIKAIPTAFIGDTRIDSPLTKEGWIAQLELE